MRSAKRASGRAILDEDIQRAKAPASIVANTPTIAIVVSAVPRLGSEFLGGLRIVVEEGGAEGHHVMDERHGFLVDLGDEFRGLRHLVEFFWLEFSAMRQSGRILTDLERRLGFLDDCVEPSP